MVPRHKALYIQPGCLGNQFAGCAGGDQVVLSELPPQERAMLRSVAREVAGISRKLTYLASTSAFR